MVGRGEWQKKFIVDSRAMARASSVFKAMFFGHFKESKPRNGLDWSVELPEDDPQGLEILLAIIHAKFNAIQPRKQLVDEVAYKVCILADKYLMMQLLSPFITQWFPYKESFGEHGSHALYTTHNSAKFRLAIAYFLGDGAAFWRVLGFYTFNTNIVDGQLMWDTWLLAFHPNVINLPQILSKSLDAIHLDCTSTSPTLFMQFGHSNGCHYGAGYSTVELVKLTSQCTQKSSPKCDFV